MGRTRGPLAGPTEDDGAWFGQRSKRRRLASGEVVDPASLGDGKRPPMYHCNNCHKDITGTIRVRCAKCSDFDLCLECLSVGVEPHPHKANHPYQVIENLAFPLVTFDWNADEELLLLEGVESYGVGNWTEVSEHVGTKIRAQCYSHYMTCYMDSPFSPLPDMRHVLGKTKAELLNMAKMQSENKKHVPGLGEAARTVKQEPTISPARIKVEDVRELTDGRSSSGFPLPVSGSKDGKVEGDQVDGTSGFPTSIKTAAGGQPRENTDGGADGHSNRSIGGKKPKSEDNKAGPELAPNYLPKRHEFDPEYDNDADHLLAEMEFKDNDTETDRELKLRILHIYLARLAERRRRKDFIIDRGLINSKKQAALEKKRSKEEKELYLRTRVFLRYHTSEEHDELLAGLGAERKIRQRIEGLQEMRIAGFRLLSEGETYVLDKRRKETEGPVKKSKESNPAFPQSAKGTNRPNRSVKREAGDGEPSPSGDFRSNHKPRYPGHQSQSGANGLNNVSGREGKVSGGVHGLGAYPGMESLSLTEQEVCRKCRLLPKQYLKMKEILVGESARRAYVTRADAYALFKIEPIKTEKVYELLVKMGWIEGESQSTVGREYS
ncbi:hypothetical protein R1sor_017085 [Riccia sorocarpa]|uniref:Transcriptional adapter n=1 Tax=Riccia sorocarpa TaxID=122646 RepID=A0ABD3I5S1_9MARC